MVTDASPQTAPQSSQDAGGQQALAVDGSGEHAAYAYQQTK